jgi:NodT family efflux transporter outer membrane factor (OMF) lipoprotein
MSIRLIAPAMLLGALAACAVPQAARDTAVVVVPAEFAGAPKDATSAAPLARWWQQFNDALLTELVAASLANNRDIRIATARVQESRAARKAARGERWPAATLSASAGDFRPSARRAALNGVEREFDDRAGSEFEAAWEVDLWGRVGANVRAAGADVAESRALLANVQLLAASDVASTYLQLRGLQAQQATARRVIELQREVMQLTEVRASVGEADAGEAAAARAELRATEARLPQLEAEKDTLIASLAVLTTQSSADLRAKLAADAPIPAFAGVPDVGVPAAMLARRPDVRAAQAALTAADARVAAAIAELMPSIRLGVRGGSAESSVSSALSLPNFDITRAIELRLPLFNRATLYAAVDSRNAARDAALASYELAVLRALADADAGFTRIDRLALARTALTDASTGGAEAVRVATARYREGDESFLAVLIAQRDQLARELALRESEVTLAVEYVSLMRNLGALE